MTPKEFYDFLYLEIAGKTYDNGSKYPMEVPGDLLNFLKTLWDEYRSSGVGVGEVFGMNGFEDLSVDEKKANDLYLMGYEDGGHYNSDDSYDDGYRQGHRDGFDEGVEEGIRKAKRGGTEV